MLRHPRLKTRGTFPHHLSINPPISRPERNNGPRCDRVQIERDGNGFRCAVCGMPYDPNLQTLSLRTVPDAAPELSLEAAVLHR